MKNQKKTVVASLAWFAVLVAYTIVLCKLPEPNLLLLVVAGLLCVKFAQVGSSLLATPKDNP